MRFLFYMPSVSRNVGSRDKRIMVSLSFAGQLHDFQKGIVVFYFHIRTNRVIKSTFGAISHTCHAKITLVFERGFAIFHYNVLARANSCTGAAGNTFIRDDKTPVGFMQDAPVLWHNVRIKYPCQNKGFGIFAGFPFCNLYTD